MESENYILFCIENIVFSIKKLGIFLYIIERQVNYNKQEIPFSIYNLSVNVNLLFLPGKKSL